MPPTVLIVDDQPTIRKSLRHLLERKGYRACEAESGTAAMQTAQVEEPEVILLDLRLPDGDGIEVLEAPKRPVSVVADHDEFRDLAHVDIATDHAASLILLHDPGHSLEERILREQFLY